MNTATRLLATFLVAFASTTASKAQPLVYDSFQGYTTGNLIGQTTTATGLTGAWLDPAPNANVAYTVATASSMSFIGGDVVVNGGTQYGLVTAGPAAGPALAAANVALSNGLTVGTGTKYISFLMRFGGSLETSDQFTFQMANVNSTTSTLRSGVRDDASTAPNDVAFVANDSSSSYITPEVVVTAGTTYFSVVKLESTGLNWSQATMWLNPTSTTVEGGGAAGSAVRLLSGPLAMNFLGFKFQNADIGDSFALDEIRIGTTWSDVVTRGLTWGGGSGDWNYTSSNWKDASETPATFTAGTIATITNGGTLTVRAEGVTSGAVTVSNTSTMTIDGGSLTAPSLTKHGAGTLVLSGNNSINGAVSVAGGTLQLTATSSGQAAGGATSVTVASGATLLISQNEQVRDAATVTLSGGTIAKGSGAISETFGALNLTGTSFLDFGTGTGNFTFASYAPGSSKLTFQNFNLGNSLTITSGTYDAGQFDFNGFGTSFAAVPTGGFTITAVPEPSTVLTALGLTGLFLWPFRRRNSGKAKP